MITVRAEDIIGFRFGIPHDTGIVDTHAIQRVGVTGGGQQRRKEAKQNSFHSLSYLMQLIFCKDKQTFQFPQIIHVKFNG